MSLITLKDYTDKYNIKDSHVELLELFNARFKKKHDYELVFSAYHKYLFTYNLIHFGKDPKYISTSDSLISFKSFINRGMYLNDYPLPKTPLIDYLFGDEDYYHIVDKYNEINNKLIKKRKENVKRNSNIHP